MTLTRPIADHLDFDSGETGSGLRTLKDKVKDHPHLFDYISSSVEQAYIENYDVASQDASANVTALGRLRDECRDHRAKGELPAGQIAYNSRFWSFVGSTDPNAEQAEVCHIEGAGKLNTIFTGVQDITESAILLDNVWRQSDTDTISPLALGPFTMNRLSSGVRLGGFGFNGARDPSGMNYESHGIQLKGVCDDVVLYNLAFYFMKGCGLNLGFDTTQTVPGTFDGVTGLATIRECEYWDIDINKCGYYDSVNPALSYPAMWIAHGSGTGDGTNSNTYYKIRIVYPLWRGIWMINNDADSLRRQYFYKLWLHGLYTDRATVGGVADDLMRIEGHIDDMQIHGLTINGTVNDGAGNPSYGLSTYALGGYTPSHPKILGWDARTCEGGVFYFDKVQGFDLLGGSTDCGSIKGEVIRTPISGFARPGRFDDFEGNTNYITGRFDQTFTVDTGTDLLTVTTEMLTGQRVRLSTTGTLPTISSGSLNDRSDYYYRWVSATTGSLHPTMADAIANTNAYDFTAVGSGTHTVSKMIISARTNELDYIQGAYGNAHGNVTTYTGWYYDNIATSLGFTDMNLDAGGANPTAHKIQRDGSITRLRMNLSGTINAAGGSLTIRVNVNGVEKYRTSMANATGTDLPAKIGRLNVLVTEDDLVTIQLSTTGSWVDTTFDASCSMEVTV